MQFGRHAPDEAEFITTVDKTEKAEFFDKEFYKFDTRIKRDNGDVLFAIPCYIKAADVTEGIESAKQLQGLLWLTGYMAKDSE